MVNLKKKASKLTVPLLAVTGALLLISLFGNMYFYIEALQFRVSVQLHTTGQTRVEIPPLGTVMAHTHATPVLLSIRLENIDLQPLQKLLDEPPAKNEIIDQGKSVLRRVAALFIMKLLALTLLGAALGVLTTRTRDPRKYITGLAAGFLLVCLLLFGTYLTYDQSAFRKPQYSGVLRAAPWMVSMAQETLGKIETLGEQLEQVAAGLNQLYSRVDELQPLGEEQTELKILHISDLHNNPAGMDFVFKVANLFDVHMIIDTGDISDFGSPLETLLLDRLSHLNIPYLFIPGNHDSPSIIEKMDSIPGVTVVNGLLELNGLVFYGVPDPSSAGNFITPPDLSSVPRLVVGVMDKLEQLPRNVDILLLHNDKMARSLIGTAPVILFGHSHQQRIETKENSILVNAGTSGASGLRGLQTMRASYSVVLLHFRPDESGKPQLVAADAISVANPNQGFALERKRFERFQNGD
ncbi:MAG: metallophosphoesterase family protein [Firmicutes bacterium]|nr:metallophosphoesterase family protein [Bacillota bacterium]